MSTFSYEARNEHGELTAGMITADSLEQAGYLLSQRNLFVVRMAGDRERGSRQASSARARATTAQLAWCMSQLAIMVQTRIRLVDALDCLARQASAPRLKSLLEEISRAVQGGRALSEAMEMFPSSFPTSLIALIRASEMSGTMGEVLHRSATYLRNDLQVLRRVRAAIMYPAFMFTICMAVTVFLLVVVLPMFAQIFATRSAVLPLPTRVLMTVSHHLIDYWYLWISGLTTTIMAALVWIRTPWGRRQCDYLVISLPLLGGVFAALYQSRMFRAMTVLLNSGVPLVDSMRVIRNVVPNVYYRELWQQVDEHIQRGERMAGPLLDSDLIAEPIAQMIDSGDRSGKLGTVFSHLADFLEEEYDRAIKTTTQFIEPCMILLMGTIIAFIAASLMLPLFRAGRVIAG